MNIKGNVVYKSDNHDTFLAMIEMDGQKYPVVDYGNSYRSMGIEKGKYLNVEASKTVDICGWIIYRLEKII